ncbi:MAG: NAD(P)H-dependent flavin oxidoreductase [Steroidobacteraceae bacterium]
MSATPRRYESFCQRFGLRVPVLLAPMAGATPPPLSIAVMAAGGMGGCGALLMEPAQIAAWAQAVRAGASGPFQMNLWIPDPPPPRDRAHEAAVGQFLSQWGPPIPDGAAETTLPDFAAQCEALIAARPAAISSIMGLYPTQTVRALHNRGIAWFATVTTVAEAKLAAAAGADVIVAQGMEAGGHRGCADASLAEQHQVGLFALLPQVVDAVPVPVVATGGIADARGVAAALLLGASAVQIGTGFLRSPQAAISTVWSQALAGARPEDTQLTRAFSGRAGRGIANDYTRAAARTDAPAPAPYPVQRGLTAPMRRAAAQAGDVSRMQLWAGQGAALALAEPAGEIVRRLWAAASELLGSA